MSKELALKNYVEIQSSIALAESERQRLVRAAMPDEVWATVKAIEMEIDEQVDAAKENLERAKAALKTEVLASGEGIQGYGLQVQYVRGSAGGFDTKRMTQLVGNLQALGDKEISAAAVMKMILDTQKPDGEPTMKIVSKG